MNPTLSVLLVFLVLLFLTSSDAESYRGIAQLNYKMPGNHSFEFQMETILVFGDGTYQTSNKGPSNWHLADGTYLVLPDDKLSCFYEPNEHYSCNESYPLISKMRKDWHLQYVIIPGVMVLTIDYNYSITIDSDKIPPLPETCNNPQPMCVDII